MSWIVIVGINLEYPEGRVVPHDNIPEQISYKEQEGLGKGKTYMALTPSHGQ